MYICKSCGEIFEEPKLVYDTHPYGMGYAEEELYVCPECYSKNYTKGKECSLCGEYVAELHDGLCDICYGDMYD